MLRRSFLRGCLSIAAGCVLSRLPLVGPRVEAVSLEGPYTAGIDIGAGKSWTAWVPEPAGGWDRSYGIGYWVGDGLQVPLPLEVSVKPSLPEGFSIGMAELV